MNTTHATQLRVGNLFRFISTDSIEQVADIRTAGIKTPTINNVLITDIEPIPLNEDWLVRFGFELVEKQYDAQEFNVYKNSYFTWNSNHGWWFCNINIENKAKIKYVHQLQNLYFALTGTELTLTDK